MINIPILVEKNIKNILSIHLNKLSIEEEQKKTLFLNIAILFVLFFIVTFTLYIKYKGKQDSKTIKEKEQKKKEYILSRLRKYQNMIEQPLTNIPLL
tara:strand:+ start:667 stop:957 length:291 start_codon:yes stop_codon:yes gene_type:complete